MEIIARFFGRKIPRLKVLLATGFVAIPILLFFFVFRFVRLLFFSFFLSSSFSSSRLFSVFFRPLFFSFRFEPRFSVRFDVHPTRVIIRKGGRKEGGEGGEREDYPEPRFARKLPLLRCSRVTFERMLEIFRCLAVR